MHMQGQWCDSNRNDLCTCTVHVQYSARNTCIYVYTCTYTRANYLCTNLSLQSLIRIIQTINNHHLMLGHKFGVNLDQCPKGIYAEVLPVVVVGGSDKMDDSLSRPLNERVVRVDGRDGTNTLVRDGCVGVVVGVCECEGKGQYNYEEYMRECLYVPYPRENTPIPSFASKFLHKGILTRKYAHTK